MNEDKKQQQQSQRPNSSQRGIFYRQRAKEREREREAGHTQLSGLINISDRRAASTVAFRLRGIYINSRSGREDSRISFSRHCFGRDV